MSAGRWKLRSGARALIWCGLLLALSALVTACGSSGSGHTGLAFTRYDGPERPSVWVARADGSRPRQVAAHGFGATLSPNGRSVAYYVPLSDGSPMLYVRDVAGGQPWQIGKFFACAWSPDGARLAFSDSEGLFLVDVKSRERRSLARGDVSTCSFAPGGAAVAYARFSRAGGPYRSDIFLVRLPDRAVRRLTDDGHSDRPVWGRSWIAYRSFHFRGGWTIGRLRLMRPDGSSDHELARGEELASRARMGLDVLAFSEDGTRLLACAAAEFNCPPVTFTVPDGRRHVFGILNGPGIVRVHELATAAALSRDGSEVLVDVGPFDGPDSHRAYAIPFAGGKPRLLARDAAWPSWAR